MQAGILFFFKVVDGKKMFLKESCLTLKFGMMDELFVNSAYPLVWILRDFFNKKKLTRLIVFTNLAERKQKESLPYRGLYWRD